ncbi:kinase-like domain-containing protein [Mycena capillaripes]|nr:kinase-like domain-containing protein [Mycena capillaripes]
MHRCISDFSNNRKSYNRRVSVSIRASSSADSINLETGASTENATSVDGNTYLVEPFRSSSVVRKFSGTLGVTADKDKLAMTVISFAHFVLEDTACTMAMVDLQGSFHAAPGGVKTMVLFDPMTHTATQDSGVGDFGFTGIQDAIDNHECNLFCKGLGLSSKAVLEATLAKQKQEHGINE